MWLDKEQFKAKMECLKLLKYKKLNISENDRRYYIATIDKTCDYIIFKEWLIKTYGIKG